jgi:hypothetical protein
MADFNTDPGMRWTPQIYGGEDNSSAPQRILTGYNDPGHVGYYSADNIAPWTEDGQYVYTWHGSDVDYTTPGFSDPLTQVMGLAPEKVADFYNLKTSDPHQYYTQTANALKDSIFGTYIRNNYGASSEQQKMLEDIKQADPAAYYDAKIGLLSAQSGWQHGQNTYDKAAPLQAEINSMLPEAQKAGLSLSDISSTANQSFSDSSVQNQQRIASIPAGNSFWHDNMIGSLKVGALALGAYGLDAALAAGEAASAAGGAGIETSGAGGLAGGGGFTPSIGSGASFAIDPAATYGVAGAAAPLETAGASGLTGGGGFVPTAGSGANFGIDASANYGLASAAAPIETTGTGGVIGSGNFTPAVDSGANFAIDPTATYTTAGAPTVNAPIGDQPGDYPMPGEDGTASQWTPSNINPQDVTNLLDYNASLNPSTSLTDALKTANQVKQSVNTANTIAKLLGGTSTATKAAGATGATSGLNLSALASLLNPSAQTNSYIGQIKANQNPFTFTSAGQTLASPGMYDVSGSNLANALRKA